MEIRMSDISEAVTVILKKEFKGHTVYGDETQEGFKKPAFFMEILRRTSNESKNFYFNRVTVVITYLPKIHTALDNMDTEDRIKSRFGMILPVNRRNLKISDIEFSQTGEKKEILQTYLRLEYHEAVEREESHEKMQKLHYRDRGSVKDYGTA